MKVVTVIGARPQFVKASPLSRVLRQQHQEILVHTGQHYDAGMSDVFFAELGMPAPDYHLNIGSGAHGAQTGAMLNAVEGVLLSERPDAVLVYGDTNSTLAGALAAAKLTIPIAHVEAGLRSFNRAMPEEINRVVADHLATWLFAPAEVASQNLAREGITAGVSIVGDIMIDALELHRAAAQARPSILPELKLADQPYYLCTIHRADNTDDAAALASIMSGLNALPRPVLFPAHPRTKARLQEFGIVPGQNVVMIAPVGYLDMLRLLQDAACVVTDSGGVQKEAYYLGRPCVTLRSETEWVETLETGWNRLSGIAPQEIVSAVRSMDAAETRNLAHPDLYGDGKAAQRIVATLTGSGA